MMARPLSPSPGELAMPRSLLVPLVLFGLVAGSGAVAEPPAVLPEGERPADRRLESLVTLDGSYFPFHPPKSGEEWQARREVVRRQILVAAGLWPEPARHEPRAIVHGRVE